MQKKLSIKQKGAMVLFRGRLLRTPVDIVMSSQEFKQMEMQLRSKNITDYTFGKVGEDNLESQKDDTLKVVITEEKEPVIEELENMSLLDRLASEGD